MIQPQLPLLLPCYDFVPVTNSALGGCLLAVDTPTSSVTSSHDVTGGVYKARERIHLTVLPRLPVTPIRIAAPFDLPVLGTPRAFILSQDRTLRILDE